MKVLLFKDQNGYDALLFKNEKRLRERVVQIIREECEDREIEFDPDAYDNVTELVEEFERERADNSERMRILEGVMAG